MLSLGLTSVTFRELGIDEIISFCSECGLSAIEWGSDVHVPEKDRQNAAAAAEKTVAAGIRVSSYGSYYRAGTYENPAAVFKDYLKTAEILGAPIIRIWAGSVSSEAADKQYYEKLVCEVRQLCDMAARYNIDIAFEFHNGTFTDSADSALKLAGDINRDNIGLYFQYDPFITVDENCRTLSRLLPYLKMIHVFNVDKSYRRFSIGERNGADMWRRFIKIAKDSRVSLLFEFLEPSTLQRLKTEACIMKNLIREVYQVTID